MKKGVIYARYSCDKQTENSTKAQIRECQEWAQKNGIAIIDIYSDEAISGRTDKRPSFQKMIADAQRGYFECIVVWKGDRFSRSRADAAKYKTMLKKLNIRVLSVTEPNIEGSQAILMDGINEAFAEYYSVELAEKINRGLDQNALDGKWNGGSVPFGYNHDPQTQRLSINEEEAKIVREIFRLYTQDGKSASEIGTILANRGVLTKRGTPISKAGVHHILSHEDYIGVYHWRKYVLKNVFPPIISEDVYNKAQEIMKIRGKRQGYAKTGVLFLLSGRVFCAQCGEEMRGRSGTSSHKGKKYYYYTCKGALKKKGCSMHDVPKQELEDCVIKLVRNEILLNPAKRDYYIERIISYLNGEHPEIPSMEKEINDLTAKINKLLVLAETLDDMDEIASRLKTLKAQREFVRTELDKLKAHTQTVDKTQLENFFRHLAECPFESIEDRRFLVDTFVRCVYVSSISKVTVFLNYRGQISTSADKPKVRLEMPTVHHRHHFPKFKRLGIF